MYIAFLKFPKSEQLSVLLKCSRSLSLSKPVILQRHCVSQQHFFSCIDNNREKEIRLLGNFFCDHIRFKKRSKNCFCKVEDFQDGLAERLFSLYITLFCFSWNTKNPIQNILPDEEVLEALFSGV